MNARPAEVSASPYAVSIMQLMETGSGIGVADASALEVKLSHPRTHKIVRFVTEDMDEEECEPLSFKKQAVNAHTCFSTVFYAALPAHLHHNSKNSLAFCKQLAFIPVTKKHVTLQVFRI